MIKLVSEQEWDAISQAINNGEGYPTPLESKYKCETWLDKSSCFDSVHGYFIPKDKVTEKYTSGFQDIQLTVIEQDDI